MAIPGFRELNKEPIEPKASDEATDAPKALLSGPESPPAEQPGSPPDAPQSPDEPSPVSGPDVIGFLDKVPCNWSLNMIDGLLVARNSTSQESFTGTMKEFNEAMRG